MAVVLGAVTPPGRLGRAITEASARARESGVEVREINLADVTIGFADGRPLEELDDDAPAVVDALASARAVLLATPVYRASMTGALKNLLDLTPVDALRGKPVGIVAMGGSHHHYLGASSHLRDILAWFGALVTPTDVYLTGADFADGVPSASAAAALDELFGALAVLAPLGEAVPGPAPLASKYF
ncbi:MAG: NADPH-dependent FMN reductase [Dehalococcoidia bacterium]